jgi:sulfotransferase famil protein
MQLPTVRAVVKRFHPLRRQLRSHFLFEIEGISIAYCYVRKNACSTFKHMILDNAEYDGKWEDAISFMTRHYAASSVAAVRSARWRIFVYRDPFERMTSLFRNKMIMQDGAANFLGNYERVTGCDPFDATFEQFVGSYLTRRSLDPHTRSQSSHLLPVSYNCASTFKTLFADMKIIIGDELATRYFAKPTNDSSGALFDEPSLDVPVRILRGRYGATGQLPSNTALNGSDVRAIVRQIYRDDYKLVPRDGRITS